MDGVLTDGEGWVPMDEFSSVLQVSGLTAQSCLLIGCCLVDDSVCSLLGKKFTLALGVSRLQ